MKHAYNFLFPLQVMDSKAYDFLKRVYTESLGKVYERDLRHLFEVARDKIGGTNKIKIFPSVYIQLKI